MIEYITHSAIPRPQAVDQHDRIQNGLTKGDRVQFESVRFRQRDDVGRTRCVANDGIASVGQFQGIRLGPILSANVVYLGEFKFAAIADVNRPRRKAQCATGTGIDSRAAGGCSVGVRNGLAGHGRGSQTCEQ